MELEMSSCMALENLTNIYPTNRIINLDYDFEEELHFSIVWTTGTFLSILWQLRVDKKRVDLVRIRSEMEASCRLLRECRSKKTTEIVEPIS